MCCHFDLSVSFTLLEVIKIRYGDTILHNFTLYSHVSLSVHEKLLVYLSFGTVRILLRSRAQYFFCYTVVVVSVFYITIWYSDHQDQDQDSLLVKRRNDNHSPGRGLCVFFFVFFVFVFVFLFFFFFIQHLFVVGISENESHCLKLYMLNIFFNFRNRLRKHVLQENWVRQ